MTQPGRAAGPGTDAVPDRSVVVPAPARPGLRWIVGVTDTAALALAWSFALLFEDDSPRAVMQSAGLVCLVVGAGLWLFQINELYLARIATIRSLELARVFRSLVLTVVAAVAAARLVSLPVRFRELAVGGLLSLLMVVVGRSAFRSWLNAARRDGRLLRDVLLVGADHDAAELSDLIATHPEAGFRVVGVIGNRQEALANGLASQYRGDVDAALAIARDLQVSGAVISVGAVSAEALSALLRGMQAAGLHIHLSNGVRGIDYRRLRAAPIMYEPLFYLESAVGFARRRLFVKRVLDLVVSLTAIVFGAPVLAACALAVKLGDGGPVLFGQVRVGRNGREFTVYKFRTMVVDAESQVTALASSNTRSGPLFKVDHDPRVTRVGRFLRASSLDELPQLFNVVRGEMSLVGPRPALPKEVATFDPELMTRSEALPGITGLWQVEARDNPSFAAYRRLDLFYVHNWSLSLDLIIMLATAEQVLARFVQAVLRGRGD